MLMDLYSTRRSLRADGTIVGQHESRVARGNSVYFGPAEDANAHGASNRLMASTSSEVFIAIAIAISLRSRERS